MKVGAAKLKTKELFERQLSLNRKTTNQLLEKAKKKGKIYEAYCLGLLCKYLKEKENCSIRLKGGNIVYLKSSGGPINKNFPYFEVYKNKIKLGEIFTDIEFLTLSSWFDQQQEEIDRSAYYEIDICLVKPNVKDGERPIPDEILIAVECKSGKWYKKYLRELLGTRRELSYWKKPEITYFDDEFFNVQHSTPPSVLLLFSANNSINSYVNSGKMFDFKLLFEPM